MLGLRKLSADARGNLARLAFERDDLGAAALEFQRLLEVHEDLAFKPGIATDLDNLAVIAQRRGDMKAACTAWTRSMTLYREIGWAKAAESISTRMRAAGCTDGE